MRKELTPEQKEKQRLRSLEYKKVNKEKVKQKNKEYREKNKEKNKGYFKIWRETNNVKVKEKDKEYREKNKQHYIDLRQTNKEKKKTYDRERMFNKRKNDILFRFKCNVQSTIYNSLKRKKTDKKLRTETILGCSIEEFKKYIELHFKDWMNWDNYGLYNGIINFGWDLDHIIPINSAKSEADVIKLNHYTNFKPLCSYTNRYIKKATI
jgi:hypothetical protein